MKLKMKRLPIYGNKTVQLAMEFGLVLSEVARKQKVKLTPEIVDKAEDIFIQELRSRGYKKTALNFIPLVLASLEV